MTVPHLISPRYDAWWLLGPGVISLVVGAALGLYTRPDETGVLLWVGTVLLIDVAHVYASLYRTYLDPLSRRLHRNYLLATPLVCLWVGMLVHLESPLWFWRVLAYLALTHFIKQHVGFVRLYARAGCEHAVDRKLATIATWAGTLGPVLVWHSQLPRNFAWFLQGDFVVGVPMWVGTLACWAQLPIWLAFTLRRLQLASRGHRNPLLVAAAVLPALNWHMGIVWFDDDRVFTVTNVVLHGVPYLALVWRTGGRAWVETRLRPRSMLATLGAFYGVLAMLAVAEEALWDRLVWHDHAQLFGASEVTLSGIPAALVVSMLTVPQATHYVLDRVIWRVGSKNPRLARQLARRVQSPLMSDQVQASHILLMYQGSERSSATRSKADAKQSIAELATKLKSGESFADLARAHSDCPSSAQGGDLGRFGRGQMVGAFETAAFGLDVGAVSEVVETPFGFHIIQRTA